MNGLAKKTRVDTLSWFLFSDVVILGRIFPLLSFFLSFSPFFSANVTHKRYHRLDAADDDEEDKAKENRKGTVFCFLSLFSEWKQSVVVVVSTSITTSIFSLPFFTTVSSPPSHSHWHFLEHQSV